MILTLMQIRAINTQPAAVTGITQFHHLQDYFYSIFNLHVSSCRMVSLGACTQFQPHRLTKIIYIYIFCQEFFCFILWNVMCLLGSALIQTTLLPHGHQIRRHLEITRFLPCRAIFFSPSSYFPLLSRLNESHAF